MSVLLKIICAGYVFRNDSEIQRSFIIPASLQSGYCSCSPVSVLFHAGTLKQRITSGSIRALLLSSSYTWLRWTNVQNLPIGVSVPDMGKYVKVEQIQP
jgi:hypothetical protein